MAFFVETVEGLPGQLGGRPLDEMLRRVKSDLRVLACQSREARPGFMDFEDARTPRRKGPDHRVVRFQERQQVHARIMLPYKVGSCFGKAADPPEEATLQMGVL
jgi:hypothetical protein